MKGLYLASPHGRLIAEGEKSAIARPVADIDEKERLIVSKENGQGLAFGIARLQEAEEVTTKEFDERFNEHKVSVAERARWWAEKDTLYLYKINKFQAFDEAKKVQVVPGTKMRMGEIKLSDEKGGPGSGNFGHAGRPGQVGGSSGSGNIQLVPTETDQDRHTVDKIKEAIENGQQFPAIIAKDNGEIIDGHHRANAYNELDLSPPVFTISNEDYNLLQNSGFDPIEIAAATYIINGDEEFGPVALDMQFSGADVMGRAWDAVEILESATKETQIFPGTKMRMGEVAFSGEKGGPGSGNFGHAGRPGKIGGSLPGKPVNVNSSSFRQWFGQSKVVGDDGEPRVLFHQTSKANEEGIYDSGFDVSMVGARGTDSRVPDGIFMKPTEDDIEIGAVEKEDIAQVPLYAKMEKPLVVDSVEELQSRYSDDFEFFESQFQIHQFEAEAQKKFDALWEKRRATRGTAEEKVQHEIINKQMSDLFDNNRRVRNELAAISRARLTELIRDEGFDSLIIKSDKGSFGRIVETFVVFDPTQVKSALVNEGNFDPNDARLTKIAGDEGFILPKKEISTEPILKLTIADTKEKAFQGFQGRKSIAQDEGILFPLFPGDETISIWMKDTFVPLTVAFLDSDCKVLALEKLEPSSEKVVSGPESTEWALEAIPEWFESFDVTVGSQLVMGRGGVKEVLFGDEKSPGGPGSGHFGHSGRPGQVGGSGGSESTFSSVLPSHLETESKLRTRKTEKAVCFDDDGNVTFQKGGTKTSIKYSGEEIEQVKGSAIHYHNHPSHEQSPSVSFSPGDLTAAADLDIQESRLVSNGYRYRLIGNPANLKVMAKAGDIMARPHLLAARQYSNLRQHDKARESADLYNDWHSRWKELADQHDVLYIREAIGES